MTTPQEREATGRIQSHPGGSGKDDGRLLRYFEFCHRHRAGAQDRLNERNRNVVAPSAGPR
jgi:hypothetical protein